MSNNNAPAAPNYGPIIRAQKEMAAEDMALQRQQFQWAQQTYNENKATTDKVVDSFLQTQAANNANAAKDRARYESIFQPLEDSLAKDALDYASPERKAKEMSRAQASVAQNFEAGRQNAVRDLEAFGINPGATRFAALDTGIRIQQGAAEAAAANQAAERVDATARALRSEAINVGRGYPTQVAGAYNTGMGAGTGAINGNLATTASGANTMGTATQYGQLAANNLTGAANTMNQGYQNNLSAYQTQQQSSGVGAAVGLAAAGLKMFAAEGGEVPDEMAAEYEGEAIPQRASPSRGKAIDDVPARLSVGEFVMPKDTVDWLGQKHFYGLIEKAQKDRAEAKQRTGAVPEMKAVRTQAMQAA
jgi:hypothetical protein